MRDGMGKEIKRTSFARTLAIIGTILVWLPIAAPVFFTLILLFSKWIFRFDFLMPAELFPSALIGGLILMWVSKKVENYQKQILWSFLASLAFLIGSQVVAVVTGLASGEREPYGWPLTAVMSVYVAYVIFHVVLGIEGLLLFRYLSKSK